MNATCTVTIEISESEYNEFKLGGVASQLDFANDYLERTSKNIKFNVKEVSIERCMFSVGVFEINFKYAAF